MGQVTDINANAKLERAYAARCLTPTGEGRLAMIRAAALDLARVINEATDYSREQSLAHTNLEQAVFWALAALARGE